MIVRGLKVKKEFGEFGKVGDKKKKKMIGGKFEKKLMSLKSAESKRYTCSEPQIKGSHFKYSI